MHELVVPFVGFLIAFATGVAGAAAVIVFWRLARFGAIGAPVIGGLLGGASSVLLQLLGGGALRFLPNVGIIDWIPVVATMIVGGGCGVITALSVGLMRAGGRAGRASPEHARPARPTRRRKPKGKGLVRAGAKPLRARRAR